MCIRDTKSLSPRSSHCVARWRKKQDEGETFGIALWEVSQERVLQAFVYYAIVTVMGADAKTRMPIVTCVCVCVFARKNNSLR